MRLPQYQIPSLFGRLDTHQTAADSFVHAQLIERLRRNHNILLAQRCRRVIFSKTFAARSGVGYTDYSAIAAPAIGNTEILFSLPFELSHRHVKECVFNIRAARLYTTDVYLYPIIHHPSEAPEVDSSRRVTVNNAAETQFSLTTPVSGRCRQDRQCVFSLLMQGGTTTNVLKAAVTIDGVGPDWVEEATIAASYEPGGVVVCTSDSSINPRMIVRTVLSAGRVYVSPNWNKLMVPSTDTIAIYSAYTVRLFTASLFEERNIGFNTEATLYRG